MSNASDMSELLAHAFSLVFVEGAPFSAPHQSFAGMKLLCLLSML